MPQPPYKASLDPLIDLEALYQQAPCGYLSLSADGIILKVNQTLQRWLGFSNDGFIGQSFITLLTKGGKMHYEMFFRPILSLKSEVKELSYELRKHNGQVLPVLLSAIAIRNQQGEITLINVVLLDITERKVYEREIFLSKKRAENEKRHFQFMADQVPEMIWRASTRGEPEYVNARFCHYFACGQNQASFAFFVSKVHPEEKRNLLRQVSKSFRLGKELSIALRLLNTSGSYEWHLLKGTLFLKEENDDQGWFGTCTNTDSHVLALKEKDEFINIASHELKTPITSLLASMQLMEKLKGDPHSPMLPRLIGQVDKNVKRLNVLVSDLLNVGQLREGQLELHKGLFDIRKLIEDSLEQFRLNEKVEFIVQGAQGALKVFADPGRTEQVFVNFVNNALKYASGSKTIIISITYSSADVKVSVSDHGPGIPADKLDQLFDRYYRVNQPGSKYKGLGLGLYICSEIIKRHKGQIGVESELGKGSTFWFSLPLR
ncbi:ATP-binding protein [Mucilaginibacter arboris]|uniref:histidine kinase n=1 Tax=Mucilaginibacter arboris TaxID=2682090 RepID=A0A7K1T073_9SPHI|nr:ATP-binding protein [Mucilaginibacter arboris]MVN22966.1 PAS domain S-box protein [Mucilaginibacter arboris]